MKPIRPVRLQKKGEHSRTAYLLSIIGAICLVVFGWIYTISRVVSSEFQSVRGTFSETTRQAREKLHQTSLDAKPITDSIEKVQDTFSENIELIKEKEKNEAVILEHIKQQIEADQLKTYAEEESQSSK
ncbi:TPA: hypothetical protein HA241_05110 [Candidatus Woesearchaeota archaeon]|nr:hypothetical protein [Candidatus Woesearchaeota archaeon]